MSGFTVINAMNPVGTGRKEHVVRRIVCVLSAVIVVMGLVGLGRGSVGVVAQEATPGAKAAMATHPIVGTWRWDNDPADPADDSYGIFAADGSYLEVTKPTNVGVGIGSWVPTGDRTADVITIFQDVDPSETFEPGTATFLMAATVDAGGDQLTGTADLQTRDVTGAVTFEASGWTLTASRVTVGPLPDFGAWQESTPVPGTPTG
jgi:hypothetical protein